MLSVNDEAPPVDQAPDPTTRTKPMLLVVQGPTSPLPVTLAGKSARGGGERSRQSLGDPQTEGERESLGERERGRF
jgi:hypothetical protein